MAPKKKGTKKGNDDWEADLGESVDAATKNDEVNPNTDEAPDKQNDVDGIGGGGLLAALKKNKSRKQKKGKAVNEDYLDGEDPSVADGIDGIGEAENLAAKEPQEATAEELFSPPVSKSLKGDKKKQVTLSEAPKETLEDVPREEDGSGYEGGTVKSKKEKEKEKKEREKQRKKEMVIFILQSCCFPELKANVGT